MTITLVGSSRELKHKRLLPPIDLLDLFADVDLDPGSAAALARGYLAKSTFSARKSHQPHYKARHNESVVCLLTATVRKWLDTSQQPERQPRIGVNQ